MLEIFLFLEEKRKGESPQTIDLQDFHLGPSEATRTPGLMDPNHARYQLRYTRIAHLL